MRKVGSETIRRPDRYKNRNKKYSTAHPHYSRWHDMMERCYWTKDKNFHHYGGRGIFVVLEWHDPISFMQWCDNTFVFGCTLDRTNNDGPYSPENCRWSTPSVQAKNRRNHTPRMLEKYKKNHAKYLAIMHKKFGDPSTRKIKLCFSCLSKKQFSEFHKSKNTKDGRQTICVPCRKELDRKRWLALREGSYTVER